MKKLLSFILILSLLFAMVPASFAVVTWEDESTIDGDITSLEIDNLPDDIWNHSINKTYHEGDKVTFQYELDTPQIFTGVEYLVIDFDHTKDDASDAPIGFKEYVDGSIKFYGSEGLEVESSVEDEVLENNNNVSGGGYQYLRMVVQINNSNTTVTSIEWKIKLSETAGDYTDIQARGGRSSGGDTTCNFQVNETGSLTIEKTWKNGIEPDSGSIDFAVESNDNKINPQKKFTLSVNGSDEWKATKALLPLGTYLITTETANGFEFETEQEFPISISITKQNPDITETIQNKYISEATTGSVVFVKEWKWDGYDGDPITNVTALWGDSQEEVEITSASGWMTGPLTQDTGFYAVDEEDLVGDWKDPVFETATTLGADRVPVPTAGVKIKDGETIYEFIGNEYDYTPPGKTGDIVIHKVERIPYEEDIADVYLMEASKYYPMPITTPMANVEFVLKATSTS